MFVCDIIYDSKYYKKHSFVKILLLAFKSKRHIYKK